ncbi:hypothetical protein DH2020_013115 [Rehmannia glutinosa]|uniref:TCP domain-containing protein n=1 Tax=Rehmannia glutinosa TaxID=99300 RepID=A0ABR0X2R0_REHGL
MNPRQKDHFQAKKESDDQDPNHKNPPKITPSSRQWSNHKNPRIVRVSRAFGGKDRHSKVCTVRGLRDRRIRLSVPTAIQLYDLQDRLGLSQPSKVVDWLLDSTKDEIDKLPPLPMLPPNFTQLIHQPTLPSFESSSNYYPYAKDSGLINAITKEGIKMNDDDQEGFGGFVAQNLFPLSNNQSCFPNMPNNYNPNNYFHFDPPSLTLSQFGGGFPFSNQTEHQDQISQNNPSTSHHQLYFCPSATNIPSLFPNFPNNSYIHPSILENEWRSQINNQFQQNQLLPTTLQLINKSFTLNVNSKSGNDTDKDNRNSSRQL